MHSLRSLSVVLSLFTAPVLAAEPQAAPQAPTAEPEKPRCEHGVQKSLCARCNPKLAPVFKAKKDWCPEHARPESQCVLCNPELAKKGVK
ncbi:hypothetical protein [Comamonas sp. JC664]|uniref:hypothetical protein n=1 Tax=Comamonas sp. JC664 TaxID=2801917 RepID=UPI00174BCDF8|nr:hypothetical protein [Comamonas sp. JC664]MBL0694648.1 hypothetical protein [Comamonas sp. JC664]GHG96466.1 hypothetical protein GCM10012319_60950 [Comamonas sp. KCTC 72670]